MIESQGSVVVTDEAIESFRRDGFVAVRGLFTAEEAADFREAALDCAERHPALGTGPIFSQYVNVWTRHAGMRALTLHPRLAAAARALPECPFDSGTTKS
ncbi:MAG: hypothetical protein ACKO5K_06315 [Armatimonadota bacterium]